jgi:hypothetical protein
MEGLSVLKKSEEIKQLISFPSLEDSIQSSRIKELESMGRTSILSYGNTRIRLCRSSNPSNLQKKDTGSKN